MIQGKAVWQNEAVAAWLASVGIRLDAGCIELSGGGNNRVYKVINDSGPFLLKEYFFHPLDTRNRLKTEFDFLTYLWNKGIRFSPQPFVCNETNHLGLYEYIVGKSIESGSVSHDDLEMARKFLVQLNEGRESERTSLPDASEACFSIRAHLDCIEGRVQKLAGIMGDTGVDREARAFVADKLIPVWRRVKDSIFKVAASRLDYLLQPGEHCLSPSDFGFHNAIRQPNGDIRFIDFEYAGWDDPAKLVCDFFCQVKVPIEFSEIDRFVATLSSVVERPDFFQTRIQWLFVAYQIKWCCIVMNEFLTISLFRRRFADGSGTDELRKYKQLEKAKMLLKQISSNEL